MPSERAARTDRADDLRVRVRRHVVEPDQPQPLAVPHQAEQVSAARKWLLYSGLVFAAVAVIKVYEFHAVATTGTVLGAALLAPAILAATRRRRRRMGRP